MRDHIAYRYEIKKGDGKGKMAKILNPPPYNLTMSTATDEYLLDIVTKGGAEMGRSPSMPAWQGVFPEETILSIIDYIKTLRNH